MHKTFVTSDQHFGNKSIIEYCNRPFSSVEDQTEQLISNWNSVVSTEDTTICLGDMIMGSADNVDLILPRLNGKIILTRGNHCTPAKILRYNNYPDKIIVKDIHYEAHGGLYFICCHFPIMNPEFNKMVTADNSEVVSLFGHIHNKRQFADMGTHSFNCCVEVTNYTPVNIHDIWKLVKEDFQEKGVWVEK